MNKNALKAILGIGFFSLLLTSCSVEGPVGPQGKQGEPGEKGETGKDGTSIKTGNGAPTTLGQLGDSYIDLDTWDYYVCTEDGWALKGNIKGEDGLQGNPGVSIVNTEIDENGDLIITMSNEQTINAGHIKDVDDYTVNFYCDDVLVDTQLVKHGEKLTQPEIEDYVVKHWYLDKEFEYEWLLYGCVVTEDMNLYGDYTPILTSLSFNKDNHIDIDEYGYGIIIQEEKEICVSKAVETDEYLTTLEGKGILFNKEELGLIKELKINISSETYYSAKIYYGNSPLSADATSEILVPGENTIDLNYCRYFTIQNSSSNNINVKSLDISYGKDPKNINNEIPSVVINTKNSQSVTSRTEYIDCNVSTIGADKDVSELKAQIKVRGNSTSALPKKPYRIKLSKKNSLFGYEKAKNWVLLADYMDGSNMHNYSALKFAKMVRGEDSFGVNPLHVNVILNGENVGLYTFGEHIDGKEGRLDIEQDNIWEKDFDDISFYIERDLSTITDPLEEEGVTYFRVPLENYYLSEYVFALKYPEKEDFEEELEGGEIDPHEEEFQAFFNNLKDYMTDICNRFVEYSQSNSKFSSVAEKVDVNSLATYGVIDQVFREADHGQKSFKMYRSNGGLLKFGPNWDYDSCAYGLPYKGTYVLNPYEVGIKKFNSEYIGERWSYMLYNDTKNGRPLFKEIWDEISIDNIYEFLGLQAEEMNSIASSSVYDCELWMNNQYYALFDNLNYYLEYLHNQLPYLKDLYR